LRCTGRQAEGGEAQGREKLAEFHG
jgi:hypothetical protein